MNLHNVPVWHMERAWELGERLQEWWLRRWIDNGVHSNIRIGDIFTLGRWNQFGLVSGRTVICGPNSGPELEYHITGDIGGHWRYPRHEWFETVVGEEPYPHFIPSATQLAELSTELEDSWLEEWALELVEYYRNHPFENTHRGHLIRKAREENPHGDTYEVTEVKPMPSTKVLDLGVKRALIEGE